MNWQIILIIALVLIGIDKTLTIANIAQAQKNYPKFNPLTIEKNPLARKFMETFGIMRGNILYALVSLIQFFLVFFLLSWICSYFIKTPMDKALYFLMIAYGVTIFNNLFYLLKHSKVLT